MPVVAAVKRGGLLVNNGFSIGFVADDDDPFLSPPPLPPIEFCGVLTGGGGDHIDGNGEAGSRVAAMVLKRYIYHFDSKSIKWLLPQQNPKYWFL